ncbi:MAG TPA: hypothetical protein VF134_05950 [Candidatus Dormibacteraeota bacterium]
MRQRILYAEEMWRRQRMWALLLIVIGALMSAYNVYFTMTGHRVDPQSMLIWGLYAPSGLVLLGVLWYYRRRSHVQVHDRLRVSNLLSAVEIEYEEIRSLRVQPLKVAFEPANRRRHRGPMTKPYEDKPALYIRLRRDNPRLPALVRKLGPRLAYEDTVVLPVPDPDALSWEISSRLPERLGANMGGQRRRKRR